MAYVSELLNNQIHDSSDSFVGYFSDILINKDADSFPALEFVAIKNVKNKIVYVPYNEVSNFSEKKIALKNLFAKVVLDKLPKSEESYIFLVKQVLDSQIVDMGGTRVVRVNDLRIGNINNEFSVLGIDASFRGLLRRLSIPDWVLRRTFKVSLIDWREAQFLGGSHALQLNTAAEDLSELHPADLANIVEDLGVKQGSSLLASLEAGDAAKVLEEIDPEIQTILVQHLGPDRAGKILSQMSSDEFADLIKTLSDPEAQEILSKVGTSRAKNVEKLAEYDDNTAGGLMTLDFVTTKPDWTIEQTIDSVKKVSRLMRSIVYVYVVDDQNRFKGGISMRRLLLADKKMLAKQLAKDFPAHSILKPTDKLSKIIRLMTKYNLYSAAVLDKDKKLVGVVTIDDVMRTIAPSA